MLHYYNTLVQVNVTADMNVIITLKGDNVLFTCNVNASQEYHIYWQFNNITIDSDDIHYISTNVNGSEVLTISNVQINDTGAYTCIAISGFQSSSARIELYVQGIPYINTSFFMHFYYRTCYV